MSNAIKISELKNMHIELRRKLTGNEPMIVSKVVQTKIGMISFAIAKLQAADQAEIEAADAMHALETFI